MSKINSIGACLELSISSKIVHDLTLSANDLETKK